MIALGILWHHHQPYYPDPVAGENLMPWVRLHGVKDYYGMALHLREVPELACTVNLVPSLLVQIQAYAENGAADRWLEISRLPAGDLEEGDCLFLLDNFFMANPERMIRPYPRFNELYRRRGAAQNSARDVLRRFGERDLRDLQVLFNLVWVHPLAVEQDRNLQDLLKKGRHYTESEKTYLLDQHLEILKKIVPLYRELAQRGQVELTTTPFYHPILPLLLDKKLAREGLPDTRLPRHTGGYPEDVAWHLQRAVELHTQVFGQAPEGLWPPEGSVCQSMIPLVAQHGFRWLATDEEILSQSTQGFISRDAQGQVRNPDRMYRPYRIREGDHELAIVFRDHVLSDRIGFHYQRSQPVEAADDFLRHLHHVNSVVAGSEPALVSIILDGENCWEHYPSGGVPFLRAVYERLTRTAAIRTVKIGSFLKEHPPRDSIPRLFAGSWICHNFGIWIGHDEDNTAWDLLHKTREHLRQRCPQGQPLSERLRQAWEEIYVAEGSDWFWWYGEDHSSAQDGLFDYLFRKHLQNVYFLLGETPPPELSQRIKRRGLRPVYTLPRSLLDLKIDGRHTYFKWLGAGRYAAQNERATMAMGSSGPLKEIHFGFDLTTLLLRFDFEGSARLAFANYDAIRIGFIEPADWVVLISRPQQAEASAGQGQGRGVTQLEAQLLYEGQVQPVPPEQRLEAAIDRIVEVAVSFALLGVKAGQPIRFSVEVLEGTQSRDRAPREGTINLLSPSPDFEQIMWQV